MRHATALRAAVAVTVLSLTLAGCTYTSTTGGGPSNRPTSETIAPSGPGSNVPPRPNYTVLSDGTATGVGWVGHSNLEGGFWALYDGPAGPTAASQAKILVVLLPDKVTEAQIAALDGSHVSITGVDQNGDTARLAGPEVHVTTITPLRNDTPQ